MSFIDADLIARVILYEDQNAFGELVRRYQSPIRGFLTKMLRGDTHLADDLAQETFVKAWRKIGSFRNESKFSTWLFGIALNEFRIAARRDKEPARGETDETPMESPAAADAGNLLRVDLTEALKELNANERAAVLLCCQNGMSHDEAARALDLPLGTVKTHVLRGKQKLRRLLSGYENQSS